MSLAPHHPVEHFGRFDLVRKIGQGGMAEIFAARDRDGQLPGEFVIKRLHKELERKRECVDLFTTEADVTMLLDHPAIVKVFEAGEVDGRYFMAMEYIHGWTLQDVFEAMVEQHKTLPGDVAVHIIERVLDVLQYIHTAKLPSGRDLGLIHRDVTPSNIYLTYDGRVKLGDFGVAKLLATEGWTQAGSIKGKLGYLAPEQCAGKPPDQGIDRYSAAIILYELLVGQRCYTGENELDIMLKIRDAKYVKPRALKTEVTRPLQRIVRKALRKWPSWRFKDAGHFRDTLVDYRDRYGQRVLDIEVVEAVTKLGFVVPPAFLG
jgi:serine/threonine-protein kinase